MKKNKKHKSLSGPEETKSSNSSNLQSASQSVQSVGVSSKDALVNLLLPLSVLLSGLILTVSVIYSASVILDRDELITKSELRKLLREELSAYNSGSASNQDQASGQTVNVNVSEEQVKQIVASQKITLGNKDSNIRIIEFADPSCPYCSIAAGNETFLANPNFSGIIPPLREIRKMTENGEVSYTWVYFPTHGNGELAAQMFYCANEKGKFWDVHDALMTGEGYDKVENQVKNDESKLDILLDQVSAFVDKKFMKDCVTSGKFKQNLADDTSLAYQLGIPGTPFFLVNTEVVQGLSFQSFEPIIRKYKGE